MSIRRFAAYFFAIAAGSTFAFASTLRGQPAPQSSAQEVAMQEEAQESLREARTPPTATDAGQDGLPPVTARLFRRNWNRRHYAPAVGAARVE